jgi:hypothetical protein
MVLSLLSSHSHGPELSFGASDRNLARESVSESKKILDGGPGHNTGGIKC